MDRTDIVQSLAVNLAAKLCDGTPANAVEKYFEVLPLIREEYDRQRHSQPSPRVGFITKEQLGL